jgi:hypothetical protein
MTSRQLPKKIAVLMGGPGSEREVSLATGRGISKALHSLGIEVVDVDVGNENFELPSILHSLRCMELSARTARCRKFSRTEKWLTPAKV